MELLTNNYNNSGSEDEIAQENSIEILKKQFNINMTPIIPVDKTIDPLHYVTHTTGEITENYTYEELFAPDVGPENPFKTQQSKALKNTFAGYVEPDCSDDITFEAQRLQFHVEGYAIDPSIDWTNPIKNGVVGTVPEEVINFKKKRRKVKADDPADVEGYLGPWATYKDENIVAKPNETEAEEIREILAKRKKKNTDEEDKLFIENAVLHIPDPYDYQNRSFLHIPHDLGVNLKEDNIPDKCYLPKRLLFTFKGHTKGITAIRWFPVSGHLFLSSGMDSKIKIWETYNKRRCIQTYSGHTQAVKDICFNNSGTNFLSTGYDKYMKLWDTETGKVVSKFFNHKMCYCIKYNPDENKQQLFLSGMQNKKILCWDIRLGEVIQEYDRHLGAISTITFIDSNRKFVTTSDDKTMRIWEWDIPVDTHYVADPSMHAIPAVTASPNDKWLACQSMDNQIRMYQVMGGLRWRKKKTFRGHMVAGYSCSPDFSPDLEYIVSGDGDGKLWIWEWNTTRSSSVFKAHDDVCISALWHPHETSKILTAGWDSLIKLWD